MALIKIDGNDVTLSEPSAITSFLATHGIDYERWATGQVLSANSTAEEVLAAYAGEIGALKARGGKRGTHETTRKGDGRPDTSMGKPTPGGHHNAKLHGRR